ncbi:MAG: hypothetical protein RRB13_12395 [bacterium]|nr:hypothetical protein [bacterium]
MTTHQACFKEMEAALAAQKSLPDLWDGFDLEMGETPLLQCGAVLVDLDLASEFLKPKELDLPEVDMQDLVYRRQLENGMLGPELEEIFLDGDLHLSDRRIQFDSGDLLETTLFSLKEISARPEGVRFVEQAGIYQHRWALLPILPEHQDQILGLLQRYAHQESSAKLTQTEVSAPNPEPQGPKSALALLNIFGEIKGPNILAKLAAYEESLKPKGAAEPQPAQPKQASQGQPKSAFKLFDFWSTQEKPELAQKLDVHRRRVGELRQGLWGNRKSSWLGAKLQASLDQSKAELKETFAGDKTSLFFQVGIFSGLLSLSIPWLLVLLFALAALVVLAIDQVFPGFYDATMAWIDSL